MNSIRKSITSFPTNQNITRSCGVISQSRSLVYLHKGQRVRGLLRDEAEFLVSPKGKKYEASEENLTNLKAYLGQEYKLPDELLLQILTHKSFAHGLKPFNEKLAIFGSHYLKYKTSLHSINDTTNTSTSTINDEQTPKQSTINGLEFSKLGTEVSRLLNSKTVLADYIRSQNLGGEVFWKKRDPLIKDPDRSGENSVFSKTLEALLGALLLHHGTPKTNQFVDGVLLDKSNPASLIGIANTKRSKQ